MGINITRKGDKTTVETDRDPGVMHAFVHKDNQLRGAMKSYNISSIKVDKRDPGMYDVKKEFDKQYKKKTGSSTGYFYP